MKTLAATFLAKLFIDTLGAIDPFGAKVYLPSPRRYVATFTLWGILGLISGFGDGASRLAGRLAAVVLLTATVLGPAGPKIVTFLNGAAEAFPAS